MKNASCKGRKAATQSKDEDSPSQGQMLQAASSKSGKAAKLAGKLQLKVLRVRRLIRS